MWLGYGHIAASDHLFVLFYAMIGLPIMMVFLANIGGSMANVLKYTYSRICCRWCRARRKMEENTETDVVSLKTDKVGQETYMPTDLVRLLRIHGIWSLFETAAAFDFCGLDLEQQPLFEYRSRCQSLWVCVLWWRTLFWVPFFICNWNIGLWKIPFISVSLLWPLLDWEIWYLDKSTFFFTIVPKQKTFIIW